jgi:hypothetical protein
MVGPKGRANTTEVIAIMRGKKSPRPNTNGKLDSTQLESAILRHLNYCIMSRSIPTSAAMNLQDTKKCKLALFVNRYYLVSGKPRVYSKN